jgi:hypothetical protein
METVAASSMITTGTTNMIETAIAGTTTTTIITER